MGNSCMVAQTRGVIDIDVEEGACLSTLREHTSYVTCVLQLTDGRLVSGSGDHTLRLWYFKSLAQQRWERRRYFLLLIDACLILSATPEDPLLLRRRSDASRLEELLCLLEHTSVLQLVLSVCEGDKERLVVRPSLSEIFANRGIVELMTKFL